MTPVTPTFRVLDWVAGEPFWDFTKSSVIAKADIRHAFIPGTRDDPQPDIACEDLALRFYCVDFGPEGVEAVVKRLKRRRRPAPCTILFNASDDATVGSVAACQARLMVDGLTECDIIPLTTAAMVQECLSTCMRNQREDVQAAIVGIQNDLAILSPEDWMRTLSMVAGAATPLSAHECFVLQDSMSLGEVTSASIQQLRDCTLNEQAAMRNLRILNVRFVSTTRPASATATATHTMRRDFKPKSAPSSSGKTAAKPDFKPKAAPTAVGKTMDTFEVSKPASAHPTEKIADNIATTDHDEAKAQETAFDPPQMMPLPKSIRQYTGAGLFHPFSPEIQAILSAPLKLEDIVIRPHDGALYLPEIKYRTIMNAAFGPGGWTLVPCGPPLFYGKTAAREYQLFCHGRFVSQSKGEHMNFAKDAGWAVAAECVKSRALRRTCKDLGVASETWDPAFIHKFQKERCRQVPNKSGKLLWELDPMKIKKK